MRAGSTWWKMVIAAGALACSRGGDAARPAAGAAATGRPDSAAAATSSGGAVEKDVRRARRTVLVFGTSLSAGLGLDPSEAYPALLQRKADSAGFNARIVNAGLSGETSAGALRRVGWLMRAPADVVLLETGANDALRAFDPDSVEANIRAVIARIRSARPTARIFLVQMEAPPNLGSRYTSAFHAMFPRIAREEGVTLVPFLLEGVAGRAELNQPDGIHPNEEGARIAAANVWPALARALSELDATAAVR